MFVFGADLFFDGARRRRRSRNRRRGGRGDGEEGEETGRKEGRKEGRKKERRGPGEIVEKGKAKHEGSSPRRDVHAANKLFRMKPKP